MVTAHPPPSPLGGTGIMEYKFYCTASVYHHPLTRGEGVVGLKQNRLCNCRELLPPPGELLPCRGASPVAVAAAESEDTRRKRMV